MEDVNGAPTVHVRGEPWGRPVLQLPTLRRENIPTGPRVVLSGASAGPDRNLLSNLRPPGKLRYQPRLLWDSKAYS